jgi:DNA polymerase delta subunit 1
VEEEVESARKRIEGRFPIPTKEKDAVILIATQVLIVGDKDSFLSILHCLGQPAFKPDDLKDTIVYTFDENDEIGMLEHWAAMTRAFDVEWLAGFNSISYDLPYIFQRAKLHGAIDVFRGLARFQALPHDRVRSRGRNYVERLPKERIFGGRGVNDMMPIVEIPGIIQFDALRIIKLLEKMSTYSLKEVAKELLKDGVQKKDLPHGLISPFFAAGPEFQRRLAIYCYFDVKVTVAVMIVRFLLGHGMEVARASYASIMQQMLQGAQLKTWLLLCKTAHRDEWLLDEKTRQDCQHLHGIECDPLPKYLKKHTRALREERVSDLESKSLRKEKKYDGAFVLPPVVGRYCDIYTNTFDFASLYPSIIQANNLCFSSWIEHRYCPITNQIYFPLFDRGPDKLSLDKYLLWYAGTPKPKDDEVKGRYLILVCIDDNTGHTECFVQNCRSLLPGILKTLTALRKVVKKEMEEAEAAGDKFREAVLDSRQAAIKVLCNASYGFCGATAGFFGFISIAIATCFMGRIAILFTKSIVEREFDGIIMYGDTDSVFCQFRKLELLHADKSREEILEIIKEHCKKACQTITDRLPPPMKLEYEKTFDSWLLLKKKQYCGTWIHPKVKMMMKGLAPVRRDCCPVASECGKATLSAALKYDNEEDKLLAPLRKAVEEICNPNIPFSRLERTVAKKAFYKNNGEKLLQNHLFDKIKQRSGVEVDTGSRVSYLITLPKNGKKAVRGKDDKVYLDGESTIYCQDNNIPVDRAYYVEKQLWIPTLRYLSLTNLAPKINSICQDALDRIWVQNSKNQSMSSFFHRISR